MHIDLKNNKFSVYNVIDEKNTLTLEQLSDAKTARLGGDKHGVELMKEEGENFLDQGIRIIYEDSRYSEIGIKPVSSNPRVELFEARVTFLTNRDASRLAGNNSLVLPTEEVFSGLYDSLLRGEGIGNNIYIERIVKAIDKLNVKGKVLIVGAGSVATYPVACAVRPDVKQVDIVQPLEYKDKHGTVKQTEALEKGIDYFGKKIAEKFNKDIIAGRINTKDYQGFVQDVNIPKNSYSFIFLLRVLNDPETINKMKRPVLSLLSSAEDEATLVCRRFYFEYRENEFLEDFNLYFRRYYSIKKKRELNSGLNKN